MSAARSGDDSTTTSSAALYCVWARISTRPSGSIAAATSITASALLGTVGMSAPNAKSGITTGDTCRKSSAPVDACE
jgi:hypothetical protein